MSPCKFSAATCGFYAPAQPKMVTVVEHAGKLRIYVNEEEHFRLPTIELEIDVLVGVLRDVGVSVVHVFVEYPPEEVLVPEVTS